jgi:hypothetical protein
MCFFLVHPKNLPADFRFVLYISLLYLEMLRSNSELHLIAYGLRYHLDFLKNASKYLLTGGCILAEESRTLKGPKNLISSSDSLAFHISSHVNQHISEHAGSTHKMKLRYDGSDSQTENVYCK